MKKEQGQAHSADTEESMSSITSSEEFTSETVKSMYLTKEVRRPWDKENYYGSPDDYND